MLNAIGLLNPDLFAEHRFLMIRHYKREFDLRLK